MTNPKDIRCARGLTQLKVAHDTGSSLPTVRLYEANPNAVSPEKRRALDAFYAELAATTEPPPAA